MGAGIFWSKNFQFSQILLKHFFESILSKFRSYELTIFKSNSKYTSTTAAIEYMVRLRLQGTDMKIRVTYDMIPDIQLEL